jgi:23S rRNA pseudouridine2605 synthase
MQNKGRKSSSRGRGPAKGKSFERGGNNLQNKRKDSYSKFHKKEAIIDPEKERQKKRAIKRSNAEEIGQKEHHKSLFGQKEETRLNKYIAHAGVCSRREADKLIQTGAVTVNGKVVTEMGYKITRTDKVVMGGQLLRAERFQYVLLNKPKDFVTTTKDPKHEKVVMNLVEKACEERIYPVGRLDRNTTGVLLFTNDGDLAKHLTHPKHRVSKMYRVTLNKEITKMDFEKVMEGFELEDGFIKADKLEYVEDRDNRRELGIEIHSGRNRIVRRIFEHLGYDVVKLDRVIFAGLTKKDLPRGRWRHLNKEEVAYLKMKSR